MKIGILLSRFPYPLEKGDKLRIFHHIKALSKNHDIYLCALSVGKVSPENIKVLQAYCKEVKVIQLTKIGIFLNLFYSLLFTKLPLQVAYFFNRNAKQSILGFFRLHKIDHLYCQLIRVAEYVTQYNDVPKTLDYMDALSRGMERRIKSAKFFVKPFVKIESMRLKRYEHFIFAAFDEKTIISAQDRDLIVHSKNHGIHIIPNGVDQEFFKATSVPKKYDLLFTGNMSYPPNVNCVQYVVKEIMPLIWKRKADATFVIAGATPSLAVQKLASEKVIVTGWVSDIRDYYSQAKVFLAPMQIGTGLQNKLLEAMAMKLPCVTSALANNALGAQHNKELIVGEEAEDFATAALQLLENPKVAMEVAQKGQRFVQKNYNWETSTTKLEALFLKHKIKDKNK